jgi:hypothetical protein
LGGRHAIPPIQEHVTVVKFEFTFGKMAALQCGFQACQGSVLSMTPSLAITKREVRFHFR